MAQQPQTRTDVAKPPESDSGYEPDEKQIVMNETQPGRLLHLPDVSRPGSHEVITLRPGANSVRCEIIDKLRKSATVAMWLKLKWLRLPKPQKRGPSLTGYADAEAVEIIRETYDVDLIDRFLEDEPRPDIREALRERKHELEAALAREERGEISDNSGEIS